MDYQEATAIVGKKSGLYDVTTINGIHQRRLFMSQNGCLCEFAPRSRTKGYPIGSQTVEHWTALNPAEPKRTNIVRKFQRYAAKADFTSPFIRKCLEADPEKDCYANGLTTGTRIDGEIISLQAIARYDEGRSTSSARHSVNGRTTAHADSTSGAMTAPYGLK